MVEGTFQWETLVDLSGGKYLPRVPRGMIDKVNVSSTCKHPTASTISLLVPSEPKTNPRLPPFQRGHQLTGRPRAPSFCGRPG